MNTRITVTTVIIMVAIMVCTTVVSGYTADKLLPAGNTIQNGEAFSINLNSLNPLGGDQVNFSVSSTNLRTTATPVIQATTFPMPFAGVGLSWINASGTNINSISVTVTEPDLTIHPYDNATLPNPKIFGQRVIQKGTYPLIRFSGTPAVAGADVGLTLWMNLTVTGAPAPNDPANLQFTLQGVSSGDFTISVYSEKTLINSWILTIVTPVSPTPSYESGAGSSVASSSGPAAAAAGAAAPGAQPVTFLIAKEGQTLETYTVTTPAEAPAEVSVTVSEGTTIRDPAGNFVSSVAVEPVAVEDVPSMPEGAGFSFSGYAVQCTPEGATFSQPVALTFSLTPEQWDAALAQANGNPALMSVQYYDKESASWVSVPTTVDPDARTVTGHVSHFSLFALIIVQAPPATPGAGIPTTPGVSPTITTAPKVSLAKTPTPKPTPTPFVSIPAIIGVLVVAGLAYTLARKK